MKIDIEGGLRSAIDEAKLFSFMFLRFLPTPPLSQLHSSPIALGSSAACLSRSHRWKRKSYETIGRHKPSGDPKAVPRFVL